VHRNEGSEFFLREDLGFRRESYIEYLRQLFFELIITQRVLD
jgi:hypothetical protein